MSSTILLKYGDESTSVINLQNMLIKAGYHIAEAEMGKYLDTTKAAIISFQSSHNISTDGICGYNTWKQIVEATFELGDRILYEKSPMFYGSDVSTLQHKLNSLGFNAGKEDGYLGEDTIHALKEFQQNLDLSVDGICGPKTIKSLNRISLFTDSSVYGIREKYIRDEEINEKIQISISTELSLSKLISYFHNSSKLSFIGCNASDINTYNTLNDINSTINIVFRSFEKFEYEYIEISFFEKQNSFSRVGKELAHRVGNIIENIYPVNIQGSYEQDLIRTIKPTILIKFPILKSNELFKAIEIISKNIDTVLLESLFI